MKTKNVLSKCLASVLFSVITIVAIEGCQSMSRYYTLEICNKSPYLCKDLTITYGNTPPINKGDFDVGDNCASEAGEFGPVPEDATISWIESDNRKYEVTAKVREAVGSKNITGEKPKIIFCIQPDRSVNVKYIPNIWKS